MSPPAAATRSVAPRCTASRFLAWTALASIAVASAAGVSGCRAKQAQAVPEVRLHAGVGGAAVSVVAQLARARGLAAIRVVENAADAEVYWMADPGEALVLGDRIAANALAADPTVDARFVDPRGRFAPVCARARVLVRNPRVALPFDPQTLRDLADPRAAGRVAVPSLTTDEGAATIAGLTLSMGNASVSRFLAMLARNEPIVAADDADVRARVARGEAAFGLVGSEVAAAGAASAAGLEVIVPDQGGRGAVVLPTAVAVAPEASPAAKALAAWLAGADAEQLLVARVPGLMPLREGVPVPVGVAPVTAVRAVAIDWDRYAEEKQKVRSSLRGWPEQWRR